MSLVVRRAAISGGGNMFIKYRGHKIDVGNRKNDDAIDIDVIDEILDKLEEFQIYIANNEYKNEIKIIKVMQNFDKASAMISLKNIAGESGENLTKEDILENLDVDVGASGIALWFEIETDS